MLGDSEQAMADIRNKEIQVQKPAQSLAHFQAKLASADDVETGLVRPLLVTGGVLVLLVAGFFGYRAWQVGRIERFEASRAELLRAIEGDPQSVDASQGYEQRLRANLPALEKLALEAPGSRRASALAEANAFHLMLEGKSATELPAPEGPLERIQAAARFVALGQGKPALDLLLPLRGKAKAGAPWADVYWTTLMDARCLSGDRAAALKDLSDYRAEFPQGAAFAQLEQKAKGI